MEEQRARERERAAVARRRRRRAPCGARSGGCGRRGSGSSAHQRELLNSCRPPPPQRTRCAACARRARARRPRALRRPAQSRSRRARRRAAGGRARAPRRRRAGRAGRSFACSSSSSSVSAVAREAGEHAGDLRAVLQVRSAADDAGSPASAPPRGASRPRCPGAPSEDPDVDTPTSFRRSRAALHAGEPTSSHSTRTGRRLPSSPLANGSGNAPTIAGMRMAALQSRWSHWMRSPGSTSHSAAPSSASEPVHPVEPVHLPTRALALQAVDRLHEAAAEAGRHVELRAQHAHHGLVLADAVELDRAKLPVAEVASDPQRRAAARALVPLPEAAARGRRREAATSTAASAARARLTAPRPAR